METTVTDDERIAASDQGEQPLTSAFEMAGRARSSTALSSGTVEKQPGALEMPKEREEAVSKYGAINWMREVTPAIIVNNGPRLNFAMRLPADVLTVMSGLRERPLEVAPPTGMMAKMGKVLPAHTIKYLRSREAIPRALAGALSGVALGFGIIYNEEKQTPEELEHLQSLSPWELTKTRFKQAFNPIKHPAAAVGLATIPNGLLYMLSGFGKREKGRIQWEILKGGLTVAAGAALNFIPDQEKAWQVSTGIFLFRAPTSFMNASQGYFRGVLPKNPVEGITREAFEGVAKEAFAVERVLSKGSKTPIKMDYLGPYYNTVPGDWTLLTKFGLNQGSNVFGLFYGGVEKLPDGRIVKTLEEKNELREQTPDVGTINPEELTEDKDAVEAAKEHENAPDTKVRSAMERARVSKEQIELPHAAS